MKFIKKIFWIFAGPFWYLWMFITRFSVTWKATKVRVKSKYIKRVLKIKLFFFRVKAAIKYKKVRLKARIILFFTQHQWFVMIVALFSVYLFVSFGDLAINLDVEELRKILVIQEWDQTTIVKGHRSEPRLIMAHLCSFAVVAFITPVFFLLSEHVERVVSRHGYVCCLVIIINSMHEYEYFWEVFLAYIQWASYPVAITCGLIFYFFPHGIEWEDDDEEDEDDEDEDWMEIWWDPVGELETAVFMEYAKQGRETNLINFYDAAGYAFGWIWTESAEHEDEEELYWLVGRLVEADRLREESKKASADSALYEVKEKYAFLFKNTAYAYEGDDEPFDDEIDIEDTENYDEYEEFVIKRGYESKDFRHADIAYDGDDIEQYNEDDYELMSTHYRQFNHVYDVFLNRELDENPIVYTGPKTAEERAREQAELDYDPSMLNWDDDWFVRDDEEEIPKKKKTEQDPWAYMLDPKRWHNTKLKFSHNDERFLNSMFPFRHDRAKLFYTLFSEGALKPYIKELKTHEEWKVTNLEKIQYNYDYNTTTELQEKLIDTIKEKKKLRGFYRTELALSTFIGKHPKISKYLFLNSLVSFYEKLKYNTKIDLIIPKNKKKIKDYKFSFRKLKYNEEKIKYYFRKPIFWYKKYKTWVLRIRTKLLERKDLKAENRWEKIKNKKLSTPRIFRYKIFIYFQYLSKDGWLRKEDSNDIFLFRFGRWVRLFLRDVSNGRNYISYLWYLWFIFWFLWEFLLSFKVFQSRIWIVGPYSVYNPKQKYNRSVFLNNRYEFVAGNYFVSYKKIKKDDQEELAWKKLKLKFANRIHRIENKRFFVKISKKEL